MRCKTLEDVVGEVLRIINDEKSLHPEAGAEVAHRNEKRYCGSDCDGSPSG